MGIEELLYGNLFLLMGAGLYWYEWKREKIDFLKPNSKDLYTPLLKNKSGFSLARFWTGVCLFITTAPIYIYRGLKKLRLHLSMELGLGLGLIALGILIGLAIIVFNKEPETVEEQIEKIRNSYRSLLLGLLAASLVINGACILILAY